MYQIPLVKFYHHVALPQFNIKGCGQDTIPAAFAILAAGIVLQPQYLVLSKTRQDLSVWALDLSGVSMALKSETPPFPSCLFLTVTRS